MWIASSSAKCSRLSTLPACRNPTTECPLLISPLSQWRKNFTGTALTGHEVRAFTFSIIAVCRNRTAQTRGKRVLRKICYPVERPCLFSYLLLSSLRNLDVDEICSAQISINFLDPLPLDTLLLPKTEINIMIGVFHLFLEHRFDVPLKPARLGVSSIWIIQLYLSKSSVWKRLLFFTGH